MKQVEDAYLAIIYTLAAAINARDNYTYEHSRWSLIALTLAEALGLSEEQKKIIHTPLCCTISARRCGHILNKPGPLIPVERRPLKTMLTLPMLLSARCPTCAVWPRLFGTTMKPMTAPLSQPAARRNYSLEARILLSPTPTTP